MPLSDAVRGGLGSCCVCCGRGGGGEREWDERNADEAGKEGEPPTPRPSEAVEWWCGCWLRKVEPVGEGEATLLADDRDDSDDERGKSRSAAEMAAAESAERSRDARSLAVEEVAEAPESVRASAGGCPRANTSESDEPPSPVLRAALRLRRLSLAAEVDVEAELVLAALPLRFSGGRAPHCPAAADEPLAGRGLPPALDDDDDEKLRVWVGGRGGGKGGRSSCSWSVMVNRLPSVRTRTQAGGGGG